MKISITKILTVFIICVLVFACKKNDNVGKLSLVLKSSNGPVFNNLDYIDFNFEFNHPESGNVNDTLLVKRRFLSCPYINKDSFKHVVPPFYTTANTPGNYNFNFRYGSGGVFNGCTNGTLVRTDSLFYTFILIDKKGNRSDSIVSSKIILKK